MFFNKEKVYSFKEGLEVLSLKEKQSRGTLITTIIVDNLLKAKNVIAAPTTGISKLDEGGWKLVTVSQSVIFWVAMIYTFKALLELALKGEGSWKKVSTGFIICAMDYLIPWGFEVIRGIFI